MKIKETSIFYGLLLIIIIFGSLIVFGLSGMRTLLGLIFVIFLPFYLILKNFDLSQSEIVVFSMFISLMLFPSLVYWLGFIIPFRISIFAIFMLLIAVAFLLNKYYKK